jgi:hypothetical protein
MEDINYKYAKIKITYIDTVYESTLIDMTAQENIDLYLAISEYGTSEMPAFKLPTSDTSFVIFSREQLDHCIFEFQLIKNKPRKVTNKKTEMIKS